MNEYQKTLYANLMALCTPDQEAFYYVDQTWLNFRFRIFLYRLASYTEFLKPGGLECRGHTFRINDAGEALELAAMPMQKFFNMGENPFVMDLDLSGIDGIWDKLDGSLISTVKVDDQFILKSKGSLNSTQAQDATRLLNSKAYMPLEATIRGWVSQGYTVNMEYMAPDNRIVIGYMQPTLKILNVRDNSNGDYVDLSFFSPYPEFSDDFIVQSHPLPADPVAWALSVADMLDDIEGYVFRVDGTHLVKVKTEKYKALHHTKDSINVPRRLFEACVTGGADDLRSMFATDALACSQIDDMMDKVSKIYNHLDRTVSEFHVRTIEAIKDSENPRKDYAIAGQNDPEVMKAGIFGLVMNVYLGKEANVADFMVKNYKKYGIKDEADLPLEAVE